MVGNSRRIDGNGDNIFFAISIGFGIIMLNGRYLINLTVIVGADYLYNVKERSLMEKVLWVNSNVKMVGAKADDGLEVVNDYLEKGWIVKLISACAMGDSINCGQAYIVIEKKG